MSTLALGQVPNSFSSGETISSSKINANFSFLADTMSRGKIASTMMCKNSYITNKGVTNMVEGDLISKPEMVFANCFNDNISLTKYDYVCDVGYSNYDSNGDVYCTAGESNKYVISSSELIQNGWFMHNAVNVTGCCNQYWFYKVTFD